MRKSQALRVRMKKFYFLRHGESLWNVENLCQGQADIELSPKGIKEALEFAEKFSYLPIAHICSSPLKRALHTAEILWSHHPQAGFSIMEEFLERDWGCLEGMSSQSMYEIEKQEEADPHFALDLSIESRMKLRCRVTRGLEKAFELHPEPFIVSHGRLFQSLCEVLGIPAIRQIENLCLVEVFCVHGDTDSPVWQIKKLSPLN